MLMTFDCHFCQQKIMSSFEAKCCMKKCNKHYCLECIQLHFDHDFDAYQYKKQTWICYHCQEKCNCEPKNKKKIPRNTSTNNEEEEPQKSSNFAFNEDPEANIIKDYAVEEKMLISRDDVIMMPFWLQRIAKRRNLYFEFMSKDKGGDNHDKLKQMLEEALKGNYESDNDDDLEIVQ